MRQTIALLLLFLGSYNHSFSSNIQVENIRVVNRMNVESTPLSVIFDISWKNAWYNTKNHDAIWIFLKYNGYYNNHVPLMKKAHRVLKYRKGNNAKIEVSPDGLGLMLAPNANFRGDMDMKLQLMIDTSKSNPNYNQLEGLQVHAIEMVYIPPGKFTLGSPDSAAKEKAAFYKSDGNGQIKSMYTIDSEGEIAVGPEDDQLYYWSENALYNGDQKGPVPADFPKGFDAFYMMKYELTQGQYCAFLNALPDNWTYTRAPFGGRTYDKSRGGIYLEKGVYKAKNPDRPMNYVSFTDGLAFSDWAALRPMTELEYTKAARGPGVPIASEFVWGTGDYDQLERYVNESSELVFANEIQESDLNEANRAVYGASYYWVMDLSGSVWEKVITLGNEVGRKFKGTHGDGLLDFGHATNEDWPKSDDEVGGFGYRGGGYYKIGTPYSDFNPHSPIGYRYYGSWSGGPRYIAYGYRAGRSASK